MKDHLAELAQRRAQLQLKAAAQRTELALHVNGIDGRLRFADQGYLNIRRLLRKPALLAGGAAIVMFMGPRRAMRLVGKAVLLMSAARRLFSLIR